MHELDFQISINNCLCGKEHKCDIEKVVICENACEVIPSLMTDYKNILLVADQNTYAACGYMVYQQLTKYGLNVKNQIFQTGDAVLIPDEDALEAVDSAIDTETQVIIAVGAGVINDICKYVSFKHKLPYMIVATAPSMDGYASVGAALILKGMKVTLNGHIPRWIVADTNVLKDAPIDMIRAGVGDVLGKLSCLNDWKLSHIINNEYFCQQIYDMVMEEVNACKKDISLYLKRDPDCIGRLMKSLVVVGIAMAYVGNSRPASGSEHHLSHFFEIVNIMKNHDYFAHGIDVAYSTVITSHLREQLASALPASFRFTFSPDQWKKEVERVYDSLAPEIMALQKKVGFYDSNRLETITKKWDEIVHTLKEAPGKEEILGILHAIGYNMDKFWNMYGEDMIKDSIVFAKDTKDRYTVLWLLHDIGLLEDYAKQTISDHRNGLI